MLEQILASIFLLVMAIGVFVAVAMLITDWRDRS